KLRCRHKDGSLIWTRFRGRVVEWDDDGTARRVVGVITNMSRPRNSTVYLGASGSQSTKLATFVDDTRAAVFGVDRNGAITEWNDAMAKSLSVPKGAALGRPLVDYSADAAARLEMLR